MKNLFANRIGGVQFKKKKDQKSFIEAKQKYLEKNQRVIVDLSKSEPDAMADGDVVGSLSYEAAQWENRGYAENGIIEFKQAAAEYIKRQFGVEKLNPETEVNHALGIKSALSQLAQVFINPEDIVLNASLSSNSLTIMAEWLGGEVYDLAMTAKNKYLPDLEEIPSDILAKAKLLYISYPNSPTGAIATKAFFKRVVKFAKANNIAVIHDAGYAALVYDDTEPLSFLAISGAKQVGVELHSLSKAFNMTGWRLAFVAGNAKMVQAFAKVKEVNDAGQFIAIQKAGITALNRLDITDTTRQKYSRRLDQLVQIFKEKGFAAEKPKGTYYLYMPAPKAIKDGIKFKNANAFAEYLLEKTGILVSPWDKDGAYICLSATFQALESEEYGVYEDLRYRLQEMEFVF